MLPDFLKVLVKFRGSFLLKNYLYICERFISHYKPKGIIALVNETEVRCSGFNKGFFI